MNKLFQACGPTAKSVDIYLKSATRARLEVVKMLLDGDVERAVAATADFAVAIQDLVNESMRLAVLIEREFDERQAAQRTNDQTGDAAHV